MHIGNMNQSRVGLRTWTSRNFIPSSSTKGESNGSIKSKLKDPPRATPGHLTNFIPAGDTRMCPGGRAFERKEGEGRAFEQNRNS